MQITKETIITNDMVISTNSTTIKVTEGTKVTNIKITNKARMDRTKEEIGINNNMEVKIPEIPGGTTKTREGTQVKGIDMSLTLIDIVIGDRFLPFSKKF